MQSTYQQLLHWIKSAGFEQWSWVIAVVTPLCVAGVWLFSQRKKEQIHTTITSQGPVAQQIGGSGSIIHQHFSADPQLVQQLLDRISEKDQQLGQNQQLLSQKDLEIDALKRQALTTALGEESGPNATGSKKQLIAQLQSGGITQALDILQRLEMQATELAQPLRARAAQLAREQGALLLGRNAQKAYQAFERANQHEPQHLPSLWQLADLSKVLGSLEQAMVWAQSALTKCQKLAASDPKNSDWQRDLSVSYDNVAGILQAQGERAEALVQYGKSLAIREKLAASDPKNSDWQRDLSVSYDNVAGILQAQGERAQALVQYGKSLAISEKLATSDPQNAQWQTDLAVSYLKLAGVAPNKAQRNEGYDQALKLLRPLDARGALTAAQENWISVIENEKAK